MRSQLKFVQICVWISLVILGFKMSTKYTLKYVIILLCSILLMVIGTIVGYLSQNDTLEQLSVLSLLFPQTTTLMAYFCIFRKKEKILTILKQIKENQHSDYILEHTNIFVRRKLICYIALSFTIIIANIIPTLLHSFHPTSFSDRNSSLVPHWFSCSDERSETPNTLNILCWSFQTRIQLIVSNIIQSLISLLLISIGLSRLTLHIVLIKEVLVHVEILHSMICKLNTTLYTKDQTTNHSKKLEDIIQQEEHVTDQLVQIVKYQQFVKILVHNIVNAWTSHNATYVMNFSGSFILLTFIVVRESSGGLNLAFKAAGMMSIASTGFILICIFGHILSIVNEDIFDAWCTVPWYLQSMKTRKLYAIALTQNMMPVHMKIFGIYKLNLQTIFKFLKIAYSILNVLLLISK